jgi:hypothetical protein
MGYTYAEFQTALATEMAVPNNDPTDPQFQAILQTLIDQGEQRCYRDLDLLYATNRQTTPLTMGSRTLDLSGLAPYLIVLEDINIVTPATQTNPDLGERMPVAAVSKEWLDAVYGSPTRPGVPEYFAMLDDVTVLLGPFPDDAYTAEVVGKFRPLPLYDPLSVNGTWLSVYLPDLFLASTMIGGTAYQHNWGAQSDDPRSALSWKTEYDALLNSAQGEEVRKKFHGWMSLTTESPPMPARPGTPGPQ